MHIHEFVWEEKRLALNRLGPLERTQRVTLASSANKK